MCLDNINNDEDFPNLLKTYPLEEAYKYRVFTKINVDYKDSKVDKWVEMDFPKLLKDTIKIEMCSYNYIYILTNDEINSKIYDSLLSNLYNNKIYFKHIKKLLSYAKNKSFAEDSHYLSKILDKFALKYPNINTDDLIEEDIYLDKMYYRLYINQLNYWYKHINLIDAIEGNINEYNKFEVSKISESDYQKVIQYWLYNELIYTIINNNEPFYEINDYNLDKWSKFSEKMKKWSEISENKYNKYKNIQ